MPRQIRQHNSHNTPQTTSHIRQPHSCARSDNTTDNTTHNTSHNTSDNTTDNVTRPSHNVEMYIRAKQPALVTSGVNAARGIYKYISIIYELHYIFFVYIYGGSMHGWLCKCMQNWLRDRNVPHTLPPFHYISIITNAKTNIPVTGGCWPTRY